MEWLPYTVPLWPELLLILLLVALAVVAMFAYVGYWLIRNAASPTEQVRARVVRKRTKPWDVSLLVGLGESETQGLGAKRPNRRKLGRIRACLTRFLPFPELTLAAGTDCYITFEFGGREEEFNVPMATYLNIEEGDPGLLVFQGEKFRHFVKGVE